MNAFLEFLFLRYGVFVALVARHHLANARDYRLVTRRVAMASVVAAATSTLPLVATVIVLRW